MSELKAICPYWNKTCEEARMELQTHGGDCGLVTKMAIANPSIIVGAPPTMTQVDICILRALQASLNSMQEGIGLIVQLLRPKGSPVNPPFGKG